MFRPLPFALLVSLAAACGVALSVTGLSQSFVLLAFAAAFASALAVARLGLQRVDARHVAFGVAVSFAFILGGKVAATGSPELNTPVTWLSAILIAPSCTCLASAVSCMFDRPDGELAGCGMSWTVRRHAVCACVLAVAWVPYFLAFFPGLYGYDSIYQESTVPWLHEGHALNDHHPVLHTVFLGMVISAFGHVRGVAVYSAIQLAILSTSLGGCASLFDRRSVRWGGVAFFGLCPAFGLFAVSVTKDVLFTAFVMLSVVALIAVRDHPVGGRIAYALFASFAVVFRNNAVVAYAFVLALLAVWHLVHRKSVPLASLVCAICPVVALVLVVGPLHSALGVVHSNTAAESLSVPLQQLARTAVMNPDDLDEEQLEMVKSLIPDYASYEPEISDNVKNSMSREYLTENGSYILWQYLAVGMKAPRTYTDSFLINTYGWWYPDKRGGVLKGAAYHPYMETVNTPHIHGDQYVYVDRRSKFPMFEHLVVKAVDGHWWERIPVVAQVMGTGSSVWVVFLALCSKRFRRCRPLRVAALFCVAYWCTLLLGPCVMARYLLPVMATAALVVMWAVDSVISSRKGARSADMRC